jgi:large subunit ribosomal protein L14
MLFIGSYIKIIDNTGARTGGLIKILKRRTGRIGDQIICSIKHATPNKRVKKHSIQKGLIVRTAKNARREDGSYLKWTKTCTILVNKQNIPIGKRILGPVDKSLRRTLQIKAKTWSKPISQIIIEKTRALPAPTKIFPCPGIIYGI